MKQPTIYKLMAIGGGVGMVAAFLQTLEKLILLQNKDSILPCNLNSVFSCSAVLQAWQSSVFGFPNSIMCLVLFTIFTTSALAGAFSSGLGKAFRLTINGIAIFTLIFALWFMWQSIFVISAICIFCLFCLAGLLLVNWAWLRINANDLPIGVRGRAALKKAINTGLDTFAWACLAAIIGLAMALRFSL